MRQQGTEPEEMIQEKLTTAIQELEQSKIEGFYDKVITDDSSEAAYEILERFIFGEDQGILEIPQNEHVYFQGQTYLKMK